MPAPYGPAKLVVWVVTVFIVASVERVVPTPVRVPTPALVFVVVPVAVSRAGLLVAVVAVGNPGGLVLVLVLVQSVAVGASEVVVTARDLAD